MSFEVIQNQCEQDLARDYCQNHELIRPKTNVIALILCILAIVVTSYIVTYFLSRLFHWFGITNSFSTLHSIVLALMVLIFLKKICLRLIELYQRYAPEETRRRCTMMPSCSEYALLALKKYNVFKGLYKTYIRLTTKCKGSYIIDYP